MRTDLSSQAWSFEKTYCTERLTYKEVSFCFRIANNGHTNLQADL